MAEKELVINNLTVKYKGLFDLAETLNVLHHAIKERGYKKHEKKSEQIVKEDQIHFFHDIRVYSKQFEPIHKRIFIKLIANNLTEKTIEIDGRPQRFQQADVQVIFDGYMHTDWENRWGQKPVMYFLAALIDKYVYRFPLNQKLQGELVADTHYIYDQVRSHLNLYKYKTGGAPKPAGTLQHP